MTLGITITEVVICSKSLPSLPDLRLGLNGPGSPVCYQYPLDELGWEADLVSISSDWKKLSLRPSWETWREGGHCQRDAEPWWGPQFTT